MADNPQPWSWGDSTTVELSSIGPSDVGLLPVGATEQHGPHLPTSTDTVIAERLCRLAAASAPAVVLPPVAIGASYGHGYALPGTLAVSPEVLAGLVRSIVLWAHRTTGLSRFIVLNAHVGNGAALDVATDHLRLDHPEVRTAVRDWARLVPDLEPELSADGADWHANRAETSMMLALAPELVRTDRMAGADDPDRTADLVFRYTATSLSTNGVTGEPSTASVELGRRLVERTVAALADLVRRASTEEPPLIDHRPRGAAPRPADTPSQETTWTP
ncbi:MAG: creatininase family protein [Acidimicrobiia bacterium]